jgi:hypothetical protein
MSRTTAIAVGLLLIAGFLLARYLGRRMGEARRSAVGEVNRILTELATAMGGRFEEGPKLTDHPLLGEVRQYGSVHLTRGSLAITVGVSYPADDLRDDRTTVRVQCPAARRWRVGTLQANENHKTGDALPVEIRREVQEIRARAFSLDLDGDALDLIAASDGTTVYIADPGRLRALVDQLTSLAEALLASEPAPRE